MANLSHLKTLTNEEVEELINTSDDFVNIKRFDYSLKKLLERYPDGAPDKVIAQALMVSEDYVSKLWDDVMERLKTKVQGDLRL